MDIPRNLLSSVNDGSVVLVLGAGSSIGATSSTGIPAPTSTQLAQSIANKFLDGEHATSSLSIVSELAISESSLFNVQEHIRELLQDIQPADFHKLLPTFSWAGLATTNYDLVIERAYSGCSNRAQDLVPLIKNGDRVEQKLKSPKGLMLLKLHGCITNTSDASVPLILSVDQYVNQNYKQGRTRVFDHLSTLSYEHPLVFIGHSLQDPDIRQFLLEFGDLNQRPRFYTVSPELTGPEKRFWEGKRISPLEGTFEEFLRTLDDQLTSAFRGVVISPTEPVLPVSERFIVHDPGLSPTCVDFLGNDVEYVRNGIPTDSIDPRLFYRGFNPRWAAIEQNFDVKRDLQDTVLADAILDDDQESRFRFFVIKGHAGSGKSVLLQRVAWEASLNFNKLCLYLRQNGSLSIEPLRELAQVIDERIYLFIDDVGDHVDEVVDLIREARRFSTKITIIAAERINEWNMACEALDPYVDREFELRYLSSREIDDLLDLLNSHRSLFRLEQASTEERKAAFEEKAGRQLLVALHEATLGKPFEDIIADEFAEVKPDLARLVYLGVCFLNRFDVPVRAGIINRVFKIRFADFKERFFQPLDALVFAQFDRRIRDYVYVTRHPHIAEIVVDRALLDVSDKLDMHLQIINSMNIDYDADRKAFRQLVQARSVAREFPDHQMAEAVFLAASREARDDPYLLHQRAIYEMIRPNGNLNNAAEYLGRARERSPHDHTLIHSLAELHLRRAENANSNLEFLTSVKAAQTLATPLASSSAVESHGFHTLAKIHLAKLRRLMVVDSENWNEIEFSEAIKSAERTIQEGLQKFPGDSYLLDAEFQLGDLLADQDRASAALRASFDKNPHNQFVAVRFAKMLLRDGNVDEAISVYKSALNSGVVDKKVHYGYARLLIEQNSPVDSDIEFHLRRSFTEGDSNSDAQFWYARQLFVNGEN